MKKKLSAKSNMLSKLIILFLTFSFAFGVFSPRSYAQAEFNICEYAENSEKYNIFLFATRTFCKIKVTNPIISITRTIDDSVSQMLTGTLLGLLMNTNGDDFGICGAYMTIMAAEESGGLTGNMCGTFANLDADQIAIIKTKAEKIGCEFNSTPFGQLKDSEVSSRTQGSLMGMASYSYNVVTNEAPPVDLGYYAKRNIQKIPILSQTAYAQEVSYNAWGLELILNIWNTMKNLAFALMSIIMLIIGIMIINRRKINPQAIVTVQQALPRIFISLFLITFSYTIGALFASAILPLTATVLRLMFGSFLEQLYQNPWFAEQMLEGDLGVPVIINMNVLVMIFSMIIRTFGAAVFSLFAITIMVAITNIALMTAVVKIIIINIKILIQIIFAPLQFALAAIPGQEHLITDWFKGMAAKVLGIPAIVFFISLAWYMLLTPFTSSAMFNSLLCDVDAKGVLTNMFTFLRGTASVTMTLLVLPLMSIMVMFFSLKADKKIEEFIMGPKKGGKR